MPSYSFRCACGWEIVKRFTCIPSDAKRESTPCEECGNTAARDYDADLKSVSTNGGQKGTIENEVAFGMEKDPSNGRPIFRDVNGRVHEVRSSTDVEAFKATSANAFAKPRMVKFRNPITGRTSYEPDRVGGLRPHPVTGEPVETGAILREHQKLVELGPIRGEYVPPSHTATGIPVDPSTLALRDIPADQKRLGILDPVTGKPLTMADCWGDAESGIKARPVAVKHP